MAIPTLRNRSFFDLPPESADDPRAPYAILPIPFERTTSYMPGTRQGPTAILDASTQVDEYDDELQTAFDLCVQTLDMPQLDDLDDYEALAHIQRVAEAASQESRFLLSLGGEHSITAPLVAALKETRGVQTVIQVDAHADLRNEYQGTPHSHACVMRRILELGLSTVQIACRSLSAEEANLIETRDLPVLWARDLADGEIDTAKIDSAVRGPVYLTIDIDALDPSEAPGTGTPEPGGLSWYSLLKIVRHVITTHNVVGADIVEVAPIAGMAVTEFLAARLAVKVLLYHNRRGGRARG